MLESSRDKNEGTYRRGEREEKSLLNDPGFELRLGREKEKKRATIIEGMSKNERKTSHDYCPIHPYAVHGVGRSAGLYE